MPRPAPSIPLVMLAVLSGFAPAPAAAQTPVAPDRQPSTAPVTRADLGFAYLRLEQAYFAKPPADDERVAAINRAFDDATKKFFSGKFAETIAEVNELTATLIEQSPADALAVALSLKPVVDPPVLPLDTAPQLSLELSSIYPVDLPPASSFQLQLRPRHETGSISRPIEFATTADGMLSAQITIDATPEFAPGVYDVVISDGHHVQVVSGQLNVVPRSLDAIRAEHEQRLAQIETDDADLIAAMAACRSRNQLLQDDPSTKDSSQFLSDLAALAEDVDADIEALAAGRDPFRRRAGDYWRTIRADEGATEIPLRVYAPQQATGDQARPLVVVLHGAGGDENMFFAGYGAGLIKSLADQHGFVAVSPATRVLSGRPERFDALLGELARDYAIDPEAIYVLGHSMGGFATVTLATKRSEQITAACCLAGGGNPGSSAIAPTLIIGGQLDSVVPTNMLQIGAEQAQQAGLPVEFRVKSHYGHTLLVGAVLPEAIEWLLSQD